MKFSLILKSYLLIILLTLISTTTFSQSYDNSAGLRLGSSNSLVFKHFLSEKSAVELMAGTRWRGFQLTALYELHTTAFNNEQFQFYYGAGGHIGAWNNYNNHPWFDEENNRDYTVIGIDAILGLEYRFNNIPISLSIDWKPELNVIGYNGFWIGDSGLSVRYYW